MMVSDLMAGRREAEARSNDLLAKLNAAQTNLQLLMRRMVQAMSLMLRRKKTPSKTMKKRQLLTLMLATAVWSRSHMKLMTKLLKQPESKKLLLKLTNWLRR